jgi:LacI family transcriptional regulator
VISDPSVVRENKRRATIADVARLAGVSRQSVSNVLNERVTGRMTPATQARIFEAMQKLDYYPDARAVRLRRRRAQAIAVSVLDASPRFLADAFTAEVLSGIAHHAATRGHRVLLSGGAPASDERSIANMLRSGEADGMIMLPSGASEDWLGLLAVISESRRPFVVVQSQMELSTAGFKSGGSVSADEYSGGLSLGRLLVEDRHRSAAFITTRVSWPAVVRRFEGICAAFDEARAPAPVVIEASDWTVEAGVTAVERWLHGTTAVPTAMFGANDVLAAGSIVALRHHGLGVPEDVSVVGFDDLDMAVALSPALTTVRVPGFAMGEAAATDLIDRIETHQDQLAHSRIFPTSIVLRQSHGPARRSAGH